MYTNIKGEILIVIHLSTIGSTCNKAISMPLHLVDAHCRANYSIHYLVYIYAYHCERLPTDLLIIMRNTHWGICLRSIREQLAYDTPYTSNFIFMGRRVRFFNLFAMYNNVCSFMNHQYWRWPSTSHSKKKPMYCRGQGFEDIFGPSNFVSTRITVYFGSPSAMYVLF